MWEWCIEKDLWISCVHLPGVQNVIADTKTRVFDDETEWMLDRESLEICTQNSKLQWSYLHPEGRKKKRLTVKLQVYAVDRRLCSVTNLKHYINRTQKLCRKASQLFINFKNPYEPISKDSISRWIILETRNAGVDVTCLKPHSTKAAQRHLLLINLVYPYIEMVK